MKGIQGLIVAAFLGIIAIALNWVYITNKTRDSDVVAFVGVKPDVTIKVGDVIQEQHIEPIKIPRRNARSLKENAYLWGSRNSVIGRMVAIRDYQPGDLIFLRDDRTLAEDLVLKRNQALIWPPIAAQNIVPELIDPGDEIMFVIPSSGSRSGSASAPETIGPFVVGSLGNRVSSKEVARSRRVRQSQERTIGIIVELENGQLDARANRLLKELQTKNSRGISVVLKKKDSKK